MAPLAPLVSVTLLLVGTAQAHFVLSFPPPIAVYDEDTESNAPCGGFTPSFSTNVITNFSVDGQAISSLSGHPQLEYIYRITNDESASGNWIEVYPVFQQNGIGNLCIPKVTVPSSYLGRTVVLGVAANGPDGLLYQVRSLLLEKSRYSFNSLTIPRSAPP
jgi:hypothetical protein